MDRQTIIYVTQTLGAKAACGIGIIGDLIAKTLVKSQKYHFKVVYTDTPGPVEAALDSNTVAIIYNYALGSTPWLNSNSLLGKFPNLVHIKTHHDMTQALIDRFTPEEHHGYKYIIAGDPTLVGNNRVYLTNRLMPPHDLPTTRGTNIDGVPVIGFQGFGPAHKGIPKLAHHVQEEFDNAVLRLHIPFGWYGDRGGHDARKRVQEVRAIIKKPGITIEASHELLTVPQVVDWLSYNTINCYFYDFLGGCGLASSPDFALAAKRPIAITRSHQFRHLWHLEPSILIEERSIRDIIETGLAPLEPLYKAYSEASVISDYEVILDRILEQELP